MHSFLKCFFKMVEIGAVSVLAICFVVPANSYALVDADKVVGLLSWAAESESADSFAVVSFSSLSATPPFSPSPGFSDGFFSPSVEWSPSLSDLPVAIPSPSLPEIPLAMPSPIPASPLVAESPNLAKDCLTVFKAGNIGERQVLLSISHSYKAFFKKFGRNRLGGENSKYFQFFKFSVLVNLFERAKLGVKLESLDEYREKWWYRLIFSCTDEEVRYFESVYPAFKHFGYFNSLELCK